MFTKCFPSYFLPTQNILSSWAVQTQVVGQIWSSGSSLLTGVTDHRCFHSLRLKVCGSQETVRSNLWDYGVLLWSLQWKQTLLHKDAAVTKHTVTVLRLYTKCPGREWSVDSHLVRKVAYSQLTHANTAPLNNYIWKSTQWKFTWRGNF